jgi:hypothetical protein
MWVVFIVQSRFLGSNLMFRHRISLFRHHCLRAAFRHGWSFDQPCLVQWCDEWASVFWTLLFVFRRIERIPIANFRPLRYATSTLLPGLLQSLFGYDAYHAGLVMSPAGIFSIMAIVGGGALIGLWKAISKFLKGVLAK